MYFKFVEFKAWVFQYEITQNYVLQRQGGNKYLKAETQEKQKLGSSNTCKNLGHRAYNKYKLS